MWEDFLHFIFCQLHVFLVEGDFFFLGLDVGVEGFVGAALEVVDHDDLSG